MMSGNHSFTIDRPILCMEGNNIYIVQSDNNSKRVICNKINEKTFVLESSISKPIQITYFQYGHMDTQILHIN